MSENIDIRVRLRGGKIAAAEAREVGRAVGDVAPSARRGAAGLDGFATGVGRVARQSTIARGAVASLKTDLGGFASTAGQAAASAARSLGYLTTAATAGGIALGVSYADAITNAELAFSTFLKSGTKARDLIKDLQDLALSSPVLDFRSTSSATKLLLQQGLEAERALKFVRLLGDAAAASDQPVAEVLPLGARALGQIYGKGKLQAEELNQLVESVGLDKGVFAQNLGLSRRELEATFAQGKNLEGDVALAAIAQTWRQTVGGLGKRRGETPEGQRAELKEAVAMASSRVIGPTYERIGDLMGRAADGLQGAVGSGKLDNIGKALGGAFDAAVPAVAGFARAVPPAFSKARKVAGDFIDALRPFAPFVENVLWPVAKGFVTGAVGGILAALRLLGPVFGFVGKAAEPMRGAIEKVSAVVGFLVGPSVLGAAGKVLALFGRGLRATRPVLGLFGQIIRTATGAVGRLFGLIGSAAGPFGLLRFTATAAFRFVRDRIGGLVGAINGKVGAFTAAARKVGTAIADGLRYGLGLAAAGLEGVLNGVVAGINLVIDGLNKIKPGDDIGPVGKVDLDGSTKRNRERDSRAVPRPGPPLLPLGGLGQTARPPGALTRPGIITESPVLRMPDPTRVPERQRKERERRTARPELPALGALGTLPGAARGGIVRESGDVVVGEFGPEVLRLPAAARVDPLPPTKPTALKDGVAPIVVQSQLVVDGKVLAESISRAVTRSANRR